MSGGSYIDSVVEDLLESKTETPAEDYDFLMRWIEKRISLLGYEYSSTGENDANTKAIVEFISSHEPQTL
jgi:hypothetical protein